MPHTPAATKTRLGNCPLWFKSPCAAITSLPIQRCRDQFRVHVLGQFLHLPIGNAVDPTIGVVIRFPSLGGSLPTTLDHHVIPLSNEAMRGHPDWVGKLGTQWLQEFGENGLLPVKRLGPFGCSDNGPADAISQAFYEGLGV